MESRPQPFVSSAQTCDAFGLRSREAYAYRCEGFTPPGDQGLTCPQTLADLTKVSSLAEDPTTNHAVHPSLRFAQCEAQIDHPRDHLLGGGARGRGAQIGGVV